MHDCLVLGCKELTQVCRKCKNNGRIIDFHKSNTTRNGHISLCRICRKSSNAKAMEQYRALNKEHDCKSLQCQDNQKQCSKCGIVYPLVYFYRVLSTVKGHTSECRLCSYKRRAQNKSFAWSLSEHEFWQLVQSPCQYCAGFSLKDNINGVDRYDNAFGYIQGNVVSCCAQCNKAKANLSLKDWYGFLVRLTNHSQLFINSYQDYVEVFNNSDLTV